MGKRNRDIAAATTSPDEAAKSSFKYANIEADEAVNAHSKHKRRQARSEAGGFSVKLEEGAATDKAKGGADFLGEDERPYLAAIKNDLAEAVQIAADEEDSRKEQQDDGSSFGVIWDRIRGREVLIAKDKELSFILENLMRLTGSAGVAHAISIFIRESEETPTLLQDLACHSCASHILEEIFERLAVLPDSATIALDRFLDFLLVTPSIFIDNQYAAHVAEKMLLRLCRIVSYKLEETRVLFTVYDPTTAAAEEVPYQKDDTTAFAAVFSRVMDSTNRKAIRKVMAVFENLIEAPEVGGLHGNVWTTAAGSVVVQALLATLVAYRTSKLQNDESSRSKKKSSDSAAVSIQLFDKLSKKFAALSLDVYGSRVAELLIALAPSALYLELIDTVCGSEFGMDEIIQNNNAHHVLIKLVEFCTDIPLLLVLTKALCEKLDVILSSGHGMILVGLSKKLSDGDQKKAMCGRHGSASEWNQCQSLFVTALKKSYGEHGPQGWTDDQKRDYFVVVVGALYPKNFRKDPKITTQNICMPGSQIIQALCHFKENSVINNSFLKLTPELLLEYCSNVFGSFAVEKLLSTQKGQKNFYQPFLKSLIDIAPELALTKFGSRTFDFIWKSVDLKTRELLVEKMLPVEPKLRTNEFGRFLLGKLNLGFYRRSADAWRTQQMAFEKQKADLRTILEMSGSASILPHEIVTERSVQIEDMPNEILVKIFKYLPLEDQRKSRRVSKRWRSNLNTSTFFRDVSLVNAAPLGVKKMLRYVKGVVSVETRSVTLACSRRGAIHVLATATAATILAEKCPLLEKVTFRNGKVPVDVFNRLPSTVSLIVLSYVCVINERGGIIASYRDETEIRNPMVAGAERLYNKLRSRRL
ncbi:hypothetical protein BV898_09622 [Hypsibius exemplaris]|uniref:F-box domain-containing protein n=1 Tax=Hypsibius exemplaris TaxID=2072580 RepID=A0A1W0WM83_HYPEX|nr:hypothetical protein BV898_09622 [Hypsibius exemplaris]